MGSFNPEQINRIKEYLDQQGLTFQPLRNEMVDHISCDIENRMVRGIAFEEAMNQVQESIPVNHFKTLQQLTMETINKRFDLARRLSYLSLALIFLATSFKLMHLPGAGHLFLASFGTIAASLLAGSISGAYLNKEKQGRIWVFSVVIGMVLLLTAYSFKTLHLPGANQLILISSGLLIISMFVVSIIIYRNASGDENLLTHLHKKYTPGIERFLLILLFANAIFKVVALATSSDDFLGQILLILVIYGVIFHYIAAIWKSLEENLSKRNTAVLIGLFALILFSMLPGLVTIIPYGPRVVMIVFYFIAAGSLTYWFESNRENSVLLLASVLVIPLLAVGWSLVSLEVVDESINAAIFNLPVMLVLIAGIILSRKSTLLRIFLIYSLAFYLFEYPQSVGLW